MQRDRNKNGQEQCEQMDRLFVQYLAIIQNENLPDFKKLPQQVQNYAKY